MRELLDLVRRVLHSLLALPEQATPFAHRVDDLQYVEIVLFWMMGAVVLGFAGWCAVRYRRRAPISAPVRTERIVAPRWLELAIAGGLLALFVGWWAWGFWQYESTRTSSDDAYEVYVTAKQWMWKFDYPEGRTTVGVLYVPSGRDVRLLLTSRDVVHSFFVPDFRLKQDAVPGRYASMSFHATSPGPHVAFCAEFCGPMHSRMWAQVVVLTPDRFERWLETGQAPPQASRPLTAAFTRPPATGSTAREPSGTSMVERGVDAAARLGCSGCHSADGTEVAGPTWRGLWGTHEPLTEGDSAFVDARYVTESMMDPEAKIVSGFDAVMPSFQGIADPADVAAIIEYIRSLAARSPEDR